jgi:hypothetical protein
MRGLLFAAKVCAFTVATFDICILFFFFAAGHAFGFSALALGWDGTPHSVGYCRCMG